MKLIFALLLLPTVASAQGRIQGRGATPPVLKLDHDSGPIAYRVTVRPGVPEPKTTVVIEVELGQNLEEPDPTYGRRKPIQGADLIVVLVGPAVEGKKKPKPIVEARRAQPLGDEGTYGASFTAAEPGVYGLYLRGSSSAGPLDHAVSVPYGTWPIPEKLDRPSLPAKLPEASAGNIANGRALCDKLCKKDIAGALPAGGTPTFLPSAFAAGLDDAKLLAAVTDDAAADVTSMERIDLLYYLRSLHLGITDFFPNAGTYVFKQFEINEHGQERLQEHKVALENGDSRATVFVVFKGGPGGAPTIIGYDDRVSRDRLKKDDKLGYVMFLRLPGDKRGAELGIALGLEPGYPIIGMKARGTSGDGDDGLNKQLASFKGLGKFNDKRSLAKGNAALRDKLTPVYLRAAELATMYYGEEREFTAFDDAFK